MSNVEPSGSNPIPCDGPDSAELGFDAQATNTDALLLDIAGGNLVQIVGRLGLNVPNSELVAAVDGFVRRIRLRNEHQLRYASSSVMAATTALAGAAEIDRPVPLSLLRAQGGDVDCPDFYTECEEVLHASDYERHSGNIEKSRTHFAVKLLDRLTGINPSALEARETVLLVHWALRALEAVTPDDRDGEDRRLLLKGMRAYYVYGKPVEVAIAECGIRDASWFKNGMNRMVNQHDLMDSSDIRFLLERIQEFTDLIVPGSVVSTLVGVHTPYDATPDPEVTLGIGRDAIATTATTSAGGVGKATEVEAYDEGTDIGHNETITDNGADVGADSSANDTSDNPKVDMLDTPINALRIEDITHSETLQDAKKRLADTLGIKGQTASILSSMLLEGTPNLVLQDLHRHLRPLVEKIYAEPRYHGILEAINTRSELYVGWYVLCLAAMGIDEAGRLVPTSLRSISQILLYAKKEGYAQATDNLTNITPAIIQALDVLSFCAEAAKTSYSSRLL